MAVEELTSEEAAALEAMKNDTGEGIEQEQKAQEAEQKEQESSDAEEVREQDPQDGRQEEVKAEFKTSREKPPEGYVPHQAMHAERLKRQELEKKIEALEAKLTPQEQPPQYVDPLEDPEGFRNYDEYRQGS